MAERRPRAVLFSPGGVGLTAALAQTVKSGSVVSAIDDQTIWTARQLLAPKLDEITLRSFSDLVAWVSRMIGSPTARRTGPSQLRSMVMKAAAGLPQDSPLATARIFPGTAQAVGQVLTELHYHGHSVSTLESVASQHDGPLAEKLRDLAFVEQQVRLQMTATNQEFGADRAISCLAHTNPDPLPIEHLVVIAGQQSTPLYDRWLVWLASQGVEIDVLLESNGNQSSGFQSQANATARLKPTVTTTVKTNNWTTSLFTTHTTDDAPVADIIECPDVLAECESALRHCFQANIDGSPFPRIGIFLRDPDKYAPLLIASSKRLGVPIDLKLSQDLLANGFATLILQTLKALAQSDVREFGKSVASSYYGLDETQAAEVRNLCRDCYRAEDPWREIKEKLADQSGFEAVLGALEWREENVHAPQPVKLWKAALIDLCTHTPFLDRMVESPLTVERDTRSQALMQRSLDDIRLQVGEQPLSLAEFAEYAAQVWSLEKVVWGTYTARDSPETPDAVRVCTSTHQLAGFDHLVVLGMLEGTMPRRRSEDPVLTDEERCIVNSASPHQDSLPTSHQTAATERDEFLRICGSASHRIVFSYPETDDQKDNIPAFYLEEIRRAIPGTEIQKQPRTAVVPPLDQCLLYTDLRLRQAIDSPSKDFLEPSLQQAKALEIVKPPSDKAYTPAQFSEALKCPFRAFARHTLKFQPPFTKTLLSLLSEVPGKVVLVRFDHVDEARLHLQTQVKEDLDFRVPYLYFWEQRLFKKGSDRLVNQWLEREWKARELWGIQDYQVQAPAFIGGSPDGFEWKLNGNPVRITQKVSALTFFGENALATVYRSSAPEIKPEVAFTDNLGDTVEIGLTLLGLMKDRLEPYVQIEGLESRRVYCLVRPNTTRRLQSNNPKIDISFLTPDDDRSPSQKKKDFFEELRGHVALAHDRLAKVDVRPTPGEACENCRYADLCRRHIQDGEQNLVPTSKEQP